LTVRNRTRLTANYHTTIFANVGIIAYSGNQRSTSKGYPMAAKSKQIASAETDPIQPIRTGASSRSGSYAGGSRSDPFLYRCQFFKAHHFPPIGLKLQLDTPVEGTGSAQLNKPTLLIHAQDANFRCCWFSRAIDFGEESGNLAFWMLRKTAMDTWFLCLRRVSDEVAAYHLKTKNQSFPIKLKRGRVNKEFKKWPRTITISHAP
jgi:hypothetical protein